MIEPDRLARAAYHNERVASRKLAARLRISEAEALSKLLLERAAQAGLEQLVVAREAEKSALDARRAARTSARAAAHQARQASKEPDPTCWNGWFDGSARPNPGPCAIGALLTGPGGESLEVSRPAGHGSSSEAEYLALLAVLEMAHTAGARNLVLHGDSRVVIDDLLGPDGASAPSLRAFRTEALRLAALIGVRFIWIPRHRNQQADRLAQQGHR